MYTEEQQTAYMKKWFNLVEKAGKKDLHGLAY